MAIKIFNLNISSDKNLAEEANIEFKKDPENESTESSENADVYFKDFLEAITNVRSEYYSDTCSNDSFVEHVLAYEIYHQWSVIIESKIDDYLLEDLTMLRINGEIGKKYLDGMNLGDFKDGKKYPDLVLHGGQFDKEHQEIVVEIKRWEAIKDFNEKAKRNIRYDLKKLLLSVTSKNFQGNSICPYKKGIFVVTCTKRAIISEVVEKIRRHISSMKVIKKTNSTKLYCVIVQEGESIVYFNLSKLEQCFCVQREPNTLCPEYKLKNTIAKRLCNRLGEEIFEYFEHIVQDIRFHRDKVANTERYDTIRSLKDSNEKEYLAMLRYCEYYGIKSDFEKIIQQHK